MKHLRAIPLLAAAALVGLAACTKDSTAPSTLVNDPLVTADVATAAGDAIAGDVATMIGNEISVALPAPGLNFDLFGVRADTLVYTRTKTCFDANDAVVTNCSPMASVRKIAFHVTVDGIHTGTNVRAAVHRIRDWTVTRNFNGSTEVSRTHDGVGTSRDTSVVTTETGTRTHQLAAVDSADAVTFNLPRLTNPWPVSGSMVRRVAVHVIFESPTAQATRDYTKRIEVHFPADAQGNVVLEIDNQTCNLNLVTHTVTGCH